MQISLQTDLVCEVNNHQCIFFFLFVLKFRTLFLWLQKKTFFHPMFDSSHFLYIFYCIGFENGQGLGKNLHEIQYRKWNLNSSVVHLTQGYSSRKYEKMSHIHSSLHFSLSRKLFCNLMVL